VLLLASGGRAATVTRMHTRQVARFVSILTTGVTLVGFAALAAPVASAGPTPPADPPPAGVTYGMSPQADLFNDPEDPSRNDPGPGVKTAVITCTSGGGGSAATDGARNLDSWASCKGKPPDEPNPPSTGVKQCPAGLYAWRFYGTNASPVQAVAMTTGALPDPCGKARGVALLLSSPIDAGTPLKPSKVSHNTVWNVTDDETRDSASQGSSIIYDSAGGENSNTIWKPMYGSEDCIPERQGEILLSFQHEVGKPCNVTTGLLLARTGTTCRNLQTDTGTLDNSLGDWLTGTDPVKVRQAKLALLLNYADLLAGRKRETVAAQLAGFAGATNWSSVPIPEILVTEGKRLAATGRAAETLVTSPAFETALLAWQPKLQTSLPCASPVQFVDMGISKEEPDARSWGVCYAFYDLRGYLDKISTSAKGFASVRVRWQNEAQPLIWPTFSRLGPQRGTTGAAAEFKGTMLHSKPVNQIPLKLDPDPDMIPDIKDVPEKWRAVERLAGQLSWNQSDPDYIRSLRARYAVGMRQMLATMYQADEVPDTFGNLRVSYSGSSMMPRRPGLFLNQTMPGILTGIRDGISFKYMQDTTPYKSDTELMFDAAAFHLYQTADCTQATVDSGLNGSDPEPELGDTEIKPTPTPTPTPTRTVGPCIVDCSGTPQPYVPTSGGTGEILVRVYMPDNLYAAGTYRNYAARIESITLMCGNKACPSHIDGTNDTKPFANIEPRIVGSVTGQLQVRPVGAPDKDFLPCLKNVASAGCSYWFGPSASSPSSPLSGQTVSMSFFTGTPTGTKVKAVVSGGKAYVQRYTWVERGRTCPVSPERTEMVGGRLVTIPEVTRSCPFYESVPDGPPQEVGMVLTTADGSAPNLEAEVRGSVGGSGR